MLPGPAKPIGEELKEVLAIAGLPNQNPGHSLQVLERGPASATAGLYRIAISDAHRFILKVIHLPDDGHPQWLASPDVKHWYYWEREALVYETSFPDRVLPTGLRAPGVYSVIRRDERTIAIWLDDVRGTKTKRWNLDRAFDVARRLGRFHGRFAAGEPLPSEPWLAHDLLRQYLREREEIMLLLWEPSIALRIGRERAVPEYLIEHARTLWGERDLFLSWLDVLPRTVAHHDVWPPNIIEHDEDMVLLDWAFTGIAPLGCDAADLAAVVVMDFYIDASRAQEVARGVWRNYLIGLRNAGWRGDVRLARLGFIAWAAIKYVWMPAHLLRIARDPMVIRGMEQATGISADDLFGARIAMLEILRDFAIEARTLARDLGLD